MKNKQRMTRIIAIILVALLGSSAVISILVSVLAEEVTPTRNAYEMTIDYMEEEQALHITQRLLYHNTTGHTLDRVVFYATANLFRRESALIYESGELDAVFPVGFAPAGIDLQSVTVDDMAADYGFQGTNETYLRVACELAPGDSCIFKFEYYLLLAENNAFLGLGETDVRLSAFYFIPGVYNQQYAEFNFREPSAFTRWLYADSADYHVTVTLPDTYLPSGTGTDTKISHDGHTDTWTFTAINVREFALSFGRRYRETIQQTDSGVTVRVLSNHRSGDRRAMNCALETISLYETWFGDFPCAQVDIVQSDAPLDALNFPGAIWIPNDLWQSDRATDLRKVLRFCLAQQYIGIQAYTEPVTDAWLSDALCEYIAYLALEETEGADVFRTALNAGVIDALRITIPGGLEISSDAALFTRYDYELIVRDRGAVVMHETRLAMGKDAWIAGLRTFYEMGLNRNILTEMNLAEAFDTATGGNWEQFLTEWLFNVDDYVDQQIEFYE